MVDIRHVDPTEAEKLLTLEEGHYQDVKSAAIAPSKNERKRFGVLQ